MFTLPKYFRNKTRCCMTLLTPPVPLAPQWRTSTWASCWAWWGRRWRRRRCTATVRSWTGPAWRTPGPTRPPRSPPSSTWAGSTPTTGTSSGPSGCTRRPSRRCRRTTSRRWVLQGTSVYFQCVFHRLCATPCNEYRSLSPMDFVGGLESRRGRIVEGHCGRMAHGTNGAKRDS